MQNNLICERLFASFAYEGLSAISAEDLNGTEIRERLLEYHLLRNCLEGGVTVLWLLMIGIPPVRLQRFIPFFEEPERHGITMIQPLSAYRLVFPVGMDRDRLVYYFTAEYPSEARNDPDLMSRFIYYTASRLLLR